MYISNQNLGQRVGTNTMNSALNRAQSQNASCAETRLFTPHIVSDKESVTANHQNYFRVNGEHINANHQNYFRS
jgi:hypothetical protein